MGISEDHAGLRQTVEVWRFNFPALWIEMLDLTETHVISEHHHDIRFISQNTGGNSRQQYQKKIGSTFHDVLSGSRSGMFRLKCWGLN
mgnify:CR=1 FL=1